MRPVATYSICACDLHAGQWGVATQSKFLAVGSVVPWAAAGVGAVATQSYANPRYGPEGLALLEGGLPAWRASGLPLDAVAGGVGSTSVAVYNAASGVTISASGTENLRFSLATNAESLALLAGLESGETASLAFLLEGEITTSEEAKFKIRREGFLYPVPGRPGQFR